MAGNKSRWIILTVVPVLIAAITAYYFYNKGPVDVSDTRGIPVEATVLYDIYLKDSVSARKNYSDKILDVTGVIASTPSDLPGSKSVLLKTSSEGSNINCSLAETEAKLPEAGSAVTVRGVCIGIQSEPDLGIMGDVLLSSCVIVSNK